MSNAVVERRRSRAGPPMRLVDYSRAEPMLRKRAPQSHRLETADRTSFVKSSIGEVLARLPQTSIWQERVYKEIHAHPELSFHEARTAALVASKLKEFGYEVVERVGRTGVIG